LSPFLEDNFRTGMNFFTNFDVMMLDIIPTYFFDE